MDLQEQLKEIVPANRMEMEKAKRHWDSLAKPLGSLGRLEEAVIRLAGICGDYRKIKMERAALVVMCGDHGVVEEGVTQSDSSVTKIVAEGFTCEKTSVAIMAKSVGVDVFPVDIGMDTDTYPESKVIPFAILNRKIENGTNNIVKEPAMTVEQCKKALKIGIDLVGELKKQGYDVIATGEMGIGNTTPSSALASVLLDIPVETATGRGAGLSDEGLERKIKAVKKAIARFEGEQEKDIFSLLAHLGGYDILGMTGLFLGGAIYKIPVLIDGFISSVAALCATKISPESIDYIFASHISKEPAGQLLIEALGLKAFITCDMCLGEGTGAIAVLPLIQMGIDVYTKMRTFDEADIEEYIDYNKKAEEKRND